LIRSYVTAEFNQAQWYFMQYTLLKEYIKYWYGIKVHISCFWL